MIIIKRILLSILFLAIAIVITGLIILTIDNQKTNYLKISNNKRLENDSYLIINANVIPMTHDTVYLNKTVYIKEGLIQSIADSIPFEDVEIIDAKNKYLLPGLMDMHVHVWDKYELGLYLSNGVTAIRNLWGMPMHLRLKKHIENDKWIGPVFFTSGPKLTGSNDLGDDKVQLNSPEEARQKVISYKERGYDFIKTYAGLPRVFFDTIIDQAKKSNIPIVSHPSFEVDYSYHFHPRIATIEHAEDIVQQALNYRLDTTGLNAVINQYMASNTVFSPTLTGYYMILEMLKNDGILASDEIKKMNPAIRKLDSQPQFERWTSEKKNNPSVIDNIENQHLFHLMIIKKFNEAGINIICSTDAGIGITKPGYAIHQELALYKEAGLSHYEVLKTATVNPSKVHKQMHNMGTIETDKWANLILTEQNPLKNLATLKRPSLVMVKGRKLSRDELDGFERKAIERKNFIATLIRYAEYLIKEK